jgi:ribonuclease HI
MSKDMVTIYCDGACSGNQYKHNKGGWGAIIVRGNAKEEIYGGEHNTTNQRMELTACIRALEHLPTDEAEVHLYSDSAYLVNCLHQKWYEKWQRNGWRNAKKQPVENKDLWTTLLALVARHHPTFHKVEGHSGVVLNELADTLARRGIAELD